MAAVECGESASDGSALAGEDRIVVVGAGKAIGGCVCVCVSLCKCKLRAFTVWCSTRRTRAGGPIEVWFRKRTE